MFIHILLVIVFNNTVYALVIFKVISKFVYKIKRKYSLKMFIEKNSYSLFTESSTRNMSPYIKIDLLTKSLLKLTLFHI